MTWQEQALAELQAKRDQIDAAMDAIRQLGGEPAAPATKGKKTARPTNALSDQEGQVLAALKAGETTNAGVAKVTKLTKYQVAHALKKLLRRGQANQTGKSRGIQYHAA